MAYDQDPNSPIALVVDDDGLLRMDIAGILEEAGFRTLEAGNADEAEAWLEASHAEITLLFTDVEMPGARDGFALARLVAEKWPHVSIVVASGRKSPAADDLPAGARFIAKPFSAELVHNHIQELLPDHQKPAPLKRS